MAMRTNLEVAPLREHIDAIDGDIADLLVRTGRYEEAIAAFAGQVEQNPSDFDLRSRQVHLLIVSHHRNQALTAAEEAAIHFRANVESVALLNEACLSAGHADGAAGALSRLHDARPNDHAILFALAEVLRGDNRDADAEKVLDAAAIRDPGDFDILRRRVELKRDAGQAENAARLLVEATASSPDLDAESASLWSQLTRSTDRNRRLRYTGVDRARYAEKNGRRPNGSGSGDWPVPRIAMMCALEYARSFRQGNARFSAGISRSRG